MTKIICYEKCPMYENGNCYAEVYLELSTKKRPANIGKSCDHPSIFEPLILKTNPKTGKLERISP